MKKKTRVILIIAAVVLLIAGGLFFNYMHSVQKYKQDVADITFEHTGASDIPDGTYLGECDAQFIYAKVQVTVSGGKISDIKLVEHRNDKGQTAEAVVPEIIAQQKIDVDAVAGATNSSQVIKKAVDNALDSAKKK